MNLIVNSDAPAGETPVLAAIALRVRDSVQRITGLVSRRSLPARRSR